MASDSKTLSEEQDSAAANTLQRLGQQDPPSKTRTKANLIRDHEDDIKTAFERGWTQKQIADALANEAGVSITTETLRNALSFKPSDIKKKTRSSPRTKAKNATRTQKRHDAKTKANTAAARSTAPAAAESDRQNGDREPEAAQTAASNGHADQNGGDAAKPAKPAKPETPQSAPASEMSAQSTHTPQPASDHAALQEDF